MEARSWLRLLALLSILYMTVAWTVQLSPVSRGSSMCRPSTPSTRARHAPLMSSLQDGPQDDGAAKRKRRRKVALPGEASVAETSVQEKPSASAADEAQEEAAVPSRSADLSDRSKELEEQLKRDIERFRRTERAAAEDDEEEGKGLGAVAEKAAGVMSKVLVADFFVVLAFLGWFVAGVVVKSVSGNGDVLDGFSALWMPVIQPALGILMAGTIGVGIYNNISSKQAEA